MTSSHRVDVDTQHPAAYEALLALLTDVGNAVGAAGLDPALVRLLRIRASQINGCAFCLRMHTRDAVEKGESPDRIAVLPAWEGTEHFSETDRAALRLTEAVARVPDGRVSDEDYDCASPVLTPEQISAIGRLATMLNALNRYHLAG